MSRISRKTYGMAVSRSFNFKINPGHLMFRTMMEDSGVETFFMLSQGKTKKSPLTTVRAFRDDV